MPLIEGVGDEVVQFAGVVLVVVVAALAWWSTNARPDRYRTVLVMRSRAHHPVTVNIRSRPNLMVTSAQDNNSSTPPVSETLVASPPESVEESRESARVIPLQEMDSIVDADVAMLDNHRLHFYRRIDSALSGTQSVAESSSDEGTAVEEVEPASTAQIREMDSIVSAMEADVNTTSPIPETKDKTEQNKSDDKPSASNVNNTSETINNVTTPEQNVGGDSSAKKILIKLKYLNDTLKEVEGSLDELLKDFKWRHFSTELSGECRVRLIFNGRVLADEAATLRALGLHHRAVVHALVHPKRPGNQGPVASTEGAIGIGARAELVAEGGAGGGGERSWDLENILMTLVSIALTIVWFFRCEYSNMFTASASVALFGLTVFYSVAIFGLYLSDTFHIDRRHTPPPAATPAAAPAVTTN